MDAANSSHPNWAPIAELSPQLRRHIRVYPQTYRGERWYVLRDLSNGRHLRFNSAAYQFIGQLDGDITVQEIWDRMTETAAEPLTQEEVAQILSQLFATDALRSGLPGDAKEFLNRYQHDRHMRRVRALVNPLSIRIRLLDPDRILNRALHWVRPLFSRAGVILWILVVGFASLLALINFSALSAAVNQDILAPSNVLLMGFVYVAIKTVHEFAHAFAVKVWGGEVHEMGITILVMVPIPYMDASAAWGFREKYKRVLVGAVGILVELFLAAIALFIWLAVEPGLVKDAAFNAVLIGSISTLLFNANPLLRFDGYYVLQDLIEIPNLYTRASRYQLYWVQRYLFGLEQVRSPVTAAGEAVWFTLYGMAAFCYRLILLVVIVLFLVEEYLFIGVALACWSVINQLIVPGVRGFRYLLTGPQLAGRRMRAAGISALLIGGLCAGLVLLPVPLSTRAEGVVWIDDQAQIYSGAEGFVSQVLVESGTPVEPGMPVVQLHAPTLSMRINKLEARRRELETRGAAEYLQQRVQSGITKEELAAVNAELRLLREQASELVVHAEVSGTLVLPDERRLAGRYLRQGDLIGYVISPERLIVRVVVPQSDIGRLRQQVDRVEVRLAERPSHTLSAQILREIPGGSTSLPSRALGAAGGGEIAVRLGNDQDLVAAEKVLKWISVYLKIFRSPGWANGLMYVSIMGPSRSPDSCCTAVASWC